MSEIRPKASFTAENGATRPTPDWGCEVLLLHTLVNPVVGENLDISATPRC